MTVIRSALLIFGLAASVGPAFAQDAATGQALFNQRCKACHNIASDKSTVGPNLRGVVGRPVASILFVYSSALKKLKKVWTPPELERFLAGPGKYAPGTRMVVQVPNPRERAALVAYLKTLR